jgi:hypothetical protein
MRTLLALLVTSFPVVAADPPKPPIVAPVDLTEWTPRPAVGKAEPYERMKDPEWDDKRFQLTDTGPVLNCSFRYPVGKDQYMAYKATVIKLAGGKAGVAFDRNTMKVVAGWTGGFVNISPRRFGLLNTPTPNGTMAFALPAGPGWASGTGTWDAGVLRHTAPLPKEWAKYKGYYLHNDRVVLKYTVGDAVVYETARLRGDAIVRSIQIEPHKHDLKLNPSGGRELTMTRNDRTTTIAVNNVTSSNNPDDHEFPEDFLKPGGLRWGKPLVTKLVRGSTDGPFALDTLTIPHDNPFKALFFCTAVDFLPDGRVVVSTAHGDVWLVRIDEAKDECHWQRFATGLYQPLGVKVIDGKIHVLERGQLTRLHDENNDGEADFYECVNNDWHCSGGEHSYDTSLETDPQGNFYFHKTGDTDTPTGGCLMRVSKDGAKSEIFCTGFRHPIGLGVSPTGIVTGADQEGNWMPATRIDQYKQGGFYGDMRAHHRATKPEKYDEPLCWLPREVDNSAGCQIWTPDDKRWGVLAGLPLHFSYGRCKLYVLLRQEVGDTRRGDGGEPAGGSPQPTVQGGVAELPVRFLSGSRTGRFHPKDGQLYVVGLNGWQTAAKADGSLQRVRLTDKPLDVPVKMEVVPDGVKLTFSRELDAKAASDPANYRAAWWGYRWSGEYGSKRWKVSDPKVEGQDDVPIASAELLADGHTVHVKLKGGARPAQSMQLGYNLASKDTTKAVTGSVFLTIHKTGK